MIFNEDCITGSQKYYHDNTIDLIICDPPFGINETSFGKHYNRDESNVIDGYVEAPPDYYKFTYDWMFEAKRVLKDNGSMYIISGWTNSDIIGRVIRELNLHLINKIIWYFSFGVATKKKFVTSHYEIFYLSKFSNSKVTFNTYCRYPCRNVEDKNSLLYNDLQSVWMINKEYHAGQVKNKNKLPEELIKKMIAYSSNENDVVCDFFLGNFTTAIAAKKMNRIPYGFELNSNAFDNNLIVLEKVIKGSEYINIDSGEPINTGQKISTSLATKICEDFNNRCNLNRRKPKKEIIAEMAVEYGRGIFSIQNILKKYGKGIISLRNMKEEVEDLFA